MQGQGRPNAAPAPVRTSSISRHAVETDDHVRPRQEQDHSGDTRPSAIVPHATAARASDCPMSGVSLFKDLVQLLEPVIVVFSIHRPDIPEPWQLKQRRQVTILHVRFHEREHVEMVHAACPL